MAWKLPVSMASAANAASAIVGAQQSFAKAHDLGALFETLTVALIVKKPARSALLPYLAEELARTLRAAGSPVAVAHRDVAR